MHKSMCRMKPSEQSVQVEKPSSDIISEPVPSPSHISSRIDDFTSRISILNGFGKWYEIHQWAIVHFINAAVLLVPGGVRVMSATAPSCMNIIVIPVKVPYPNPGNPCDGLLKANPNIVALSGDACPRYTELEALMMEKNDSRYVGLLLVLFTVKGTDHIMLCPRPIYRTRDPQLVRQPSTQDALLDFMSLCAHYISGGLSLGRVDSPAFAVPGRLVKKSRREWGWTPLFDDWEGRRIDFNGRYTFKTKMCIPHLMEFVTSL